VDSWARPHATKVRDHLANIRQGSFDWAAAGPDDLLVICTRSLPFTKQQLRIGTIWLASQHFERENILNEKFDDNCEGKASIAFVRFAPAHKDGESSQYILVGGTTGDN
jgi:hypothetical protein